MNDRCVLHGAVAPVRFHHLRPLAAACAVALFAIASAAPAAAQESASPQQTTPTATSTSPVVGKTAADDKSQSDKKKPKAPVTDLSRVVVTGISGSIESSMKTKEDANDIVEAISAEDIGKLPDVSIADSLARVPGLATQRADGQANAISIRGLSPDFAGTTLNGREQATVGENRGVEYDQYPAELINGVTIYKTPDASLVGQGLSGTVDLHTINPLDLSRRTLVFNLRGAHNSNGSLNPGTGTGTSGHRASISYVDQFLDHTLGVAVGFAMVDQPIQEKQYQAWWWSADNGSAGIDQNWGGPHTPGMPDNVISQEGMQLRAQSQTQKRNGLMAVLEWAPNDVYYSKLDMYYSTFSKRKYTNGAQWSSSPYDHVGYDNVQTSPGQPLPIVTSGTILGVAPILQNEYTKEHDKLYSIGWNNKLYVGDWTLMADLSSSSARVKLHDAYLFSGLADGAFTSIDFNTPSGFGYPDFRPGVDLGDPGTMVFTDPGSPWSNPPGYGYDGREEFDRQDDTIHALRLQVSHPVGWIFSNVDVGVAWSDRTKTKHADVFFAYLNGNGSTADTYQSHFSAPIDPSLLRGTTSLGYGGIPGIVNYNVLGALYGNQFYLVQKNGQGDWSRNYTVEEKVPLGYVKFNIDTHLGDVPLRGNVGVQFVHTNQSSQALQTNGNALVGKITGGASYNNVLPSLNLVAEIGHRQYLRFGLAKTMARGRIDDEKVATSAGVSQITTGPGAGQILWSGSGGNPQLRPYVAVGTDLSWEKYFGNASYVAVAAFHKNLLNYIYNKTVLDYDFSNYTNDTPTLIPTSNKGSFTTPENGTGGKMDGLELSGAIEGGLLTSALQGFGAQANFSLTHSSIPLSSISSVPGGPKTLPGLSRKVANLALFYERYGFSIRVAERYRSSFTGEAVALFDQLGYTQIQANRQTDLQLGYAFSEGRWKGLSLLLQVNNLTNSSDSTVQVSTLPNNVPLTRPLEYDTWGRTVLFGINYKL
ncbi:TonB-dependent receptor [Rhodanobacter glycinis]|uniref:TonB-dependent receptor n=1 Tax=Rhodanobacter glycinis TaxID=582702 RepID=A0A1I4C213_9GAMM|nr:TonB-dependent receptor [Rhodanobacter glycinis]SFK74226.1 TonB-dependent receptor [Rhodanobacter glycinis]